MIDGNLKFAYGTGAIIAIVAIIMVFLILLLIIWLTELVAKFTKGDEKQEDKVVEQTSVEPVVEKTRLDLNDEDATVAALVASIDYRLTHKGDVKVVSVREL